ncbi:hypothetical protein [Serratia inhibens]|uniref:hypothetical protein n=1 Tax=Serratia inhibens TaxID=2338073 RepID=UPI003217B8AE
MTDIVKYQNNLVKGAELLPSPHPMDGSSKSSILIYGDQEPELSETLKALSEGEEVFFDVNDETLSCRVESVDRQRNIIVLKTEQQQSEADTPYQQPT